MKTAKPGARPHTTPLDCVILVEGPVPESLLCELAELDSLRLQDEAAPTRATTTLVGVVSEYSQLHGLLSRLVAQNYSILSASAHALSPCETQAGGR